MHVKQIKMPFVEGKKKFDFFEGEVCTKGKNGQSAKVLEETKSKDPMCTGFEAGALGFFPMCKLCRLRAGAAIILSSRDPRGEENAQFISFLGLEKRWGIFDVMRGVVLVVGSKLSTRWMTP